MMVTKECDFDLIFFFCFTFHWAACICFWYEIEQDIALLNLSHMWLNSDWCMTCSIWNNASVNCPHVMLEMFGTNTRTSAYKEMFLLTNGKEG